MSAAYVDSSAIVAIAFEELGWPEVEQRLGQFDDLWSSNLLEAEIRAAYRREQREFRPEILIRCQMGYSGSAIDSGNLDGRRQRDT